MTKKQIAIVSDIIKIRKEIAKDKINWKLVNRLVEKHDLSDTEFREKLAAGGRKSILSDYLLDLNYYLTPDAMSYDFTD